MSHAIHTKKTSWFYSAFYCPDTKIFRIVNDFLSIITLASILGIILESVLSLSHYRAIFYGIEYVTASIFAVEYLSRLITAPRKLKYVFSFFGIVDLLSIIPSFLHIANLTPLKSARSLRILRLLRILRVAKIARFHKDTFNREREFNELYYLNVKIYVFFFASVVAILGSLVYVFEHEHSEGFQHIPASMLWVLRNILEDPFIQVAPQTSGGIAISLIARFFGLILLGFLIHVIGNIINHFLLGTKKVTDDREIKETL